jgi:hypothetical protein
MYSICYTNQVHIINYICILNTQLQHILVQVYHLQGAQYAKFKTSCQCLAILFTRMQGEVFSLNLALKYARSS